MVHKSVLLNMIIIVALVTLGVRTIAGADDDIPTFPMHFACDDVQHVYADYDNHPHLLGTNSNWRTIISVRVPTMTKVLSVSCRNYGGPAGILASTVRNNIILTNSSAWRCSSEYSEGWNTASFVEDSTWHSAQFIDKNKHPKHVGWRSHTKPSKFTNLTIHSNATWIGARGVDYVANATSYCRLKLVYYFQMICDDKSDLFADGVYIGSQSGYKALSSLMEIPRLATLFAVNCSNLGSFSGLLGSTTDGRLITDSQWKIYYQKRNVSWEDQHKYAGKAKNIRTIGAHPGADWYKPRFNDSDWKNALQVLNNTGRKKGTWPVNVHRNISAEAWWIAGIYQPDKYSVQATDRSCQYFRRCLTCLGNSKCRKNKTQKKPIFKKKIHGRPIIQQRRSP